MGRLLDGLLYEVGARDPLSIVAAVTVMMMACLLASWIPASRATRADPLRALRDD